MSKLDQELLSQSIDKVLAFSAGKEVDGKAGKVRNFTETVELQVRPWISAPPMLPSRAGHSPSRLPRRGALAHISPSFFTECAARGTRRGPATRRGT